MKGETNMNRRIMMAVLTCCASALAEDTAFTEETAAAYLKLTPPVRVLSYGGYLDGGSIGLSLADATAKGIHIFEDYSMGRDVLIANPRLSESEREAARNSPDTSGRIFIGQGSPEKDRKITSVEEGQRIKAAAECLAIAWLDREFTPEQQTLFLIPQKERRTNPKFLELEKRMIPQKEDIKTEEEADAFLNYRMERTLRFSAAILVAKLKETGSIRKKSPTAAPIPEAPEPNP